MGGKAKPTKHTTKEINKKVAEATQNKASIRLLRESKYETRMLFYALFSVAYDDTRIFSRVHIVGASGIDKGCGISCRVVERQACKTERVGQLGMQNTSAQSVPQLAPVWRA